MNQSPTSTPTTTAVATQSYRVHLHAVVRFSCDVGSANSYADAIEQALKQSDLNEYFGKGRTSEYADELRHIVVDLHGDEEYVNTKCFEAHPDSGVWTDIEVLKAEQERAEATQATLCKLLKDFMDHTVEDLIKNSPEWLPDDIPAFKAARVQLKAMGIVYKHENYDPSSYEKNEEYSPKQG